MSAISASTQKPETFVRKGGDPVARALLPSASTKVGESVVATIVAKLPHDEPDRGQGGTRRAQHFPVT